MRQENIPVIPLQAAANVNGAAIPSQNLFNASAQIVSTGTVVGTLKFQASNDVSNNSSTFAPTNWSDIPSATVSITTGGGAFLIPIQNLCYEYIRVVFTLTSGTGNISSNLKALGQ